MVKHIYRSKGENKRILLETTRNGIWLEEYDGPVKTGKRKKGRFVTHTELNELLNEGIISKHLFVRY